MTAYGRSSKEFKGVKWIVEVHSVNRKFLDIHVHLPKELLVFDIEIRRWVGELYKRGLVTVKVSFQQDNLVLQESELFIKAMKKLKGTWVSIANTLGYTEQTVKLEFLADQMANLSLKELTEDESEILQFLTSLVHDALKDGQAMREKEGAVLAQDLNKRVQLIRSYIKQIEANAGLISEKFRLKLMERLKGILHEVPLEDERVLKEVAIYAEKVDITEEIVRLNSHLKQIEDLLTGRQELIGRTLDFLIQELFREANTLTAKSADLEIAKLGIEVKAEIEKMREQVQNIE